MGIKVEQIHCGQYKKYGDFVMVWKLETNEENKQAVLDYCFNNLYKRQIPESTEWHTNIRYGGEKSGDANYYFAGHYKLEKKEYGWLFTVCEPYCD